MVNNHRDQGTTYLELTYIKKGYSIKADLYRYSIQTPASNSEILKDGGEIYGEIPFGC